MGLIGLIFKLRPSSSMDGSVRPSVQLSIFTYHTYYTSKQMYNWMKWLRLLGGWHFIAATAIKPPKAACQFAADDILFYEFCYYNPMDLFHHLEKGKEELSPLQYHIKSLHIISRHYKKSLLGSQIYHGYEELSTDKNYPIWRRQERRSKCAVQLASWQLRSNSPTTSVRPSVCLSVRHTFLTMFLSSYHHEIFRSY